MVTDLLECAGRLIVEADPPRRHGSPASAQVGERVDEAAAQLLFPHLRIRHQEAARGLACRRHGVVRLRPVLAR